MRACVGKAAELEDNRHVEDDQSSLITKQSSAKQFKFSSTAAACTE
jgi:hypothetical protein